MTIQRYPDVMSPRRPRWAQYLADHRWAWTLCWFVFGVGLAISTNALREWNFWAPVVIIFVPLVAGITWMLVNAPRQKSCFMCMRTHTVMVPRVGARLPWWMPLRSRDVTWVCEHHFTSWLRLYDPVSS